MTTAGVQFEDEQTIYVRTQLLGGRTSYFAELLKRTRVVRTETQAVVIALIIAVAILCLAAALLTHALVPPTPIEFKS